MKNSFDELEKVSMRSFYNGPQQNVRKKISSSLGTMRFLGHIADVYVNRLVDTMVGMATGPSGGPKKHLPEGEERQRSEDSSNPLGDTKYPNL